MTKYYVRSVSLKHLFTLVCVIVYAIIFRLRKHEGLRKKICKLLWEGKHCAQTLEHEILIWFHDTYVRNCCYFRRLYPIVSSYMSYQGYFHFYIQEHCSIQISTASIKWRHYITFLFYLLNKLSSKSYPLSILHSLYQVMFHIILKAF